ncbi:MAG: TonB-dependent receptor [Alistipes putredinis]
MKEIQTKRTPRFRRWCRKGYAAFASLRRQVTIGVLSVSMSTILLSTTTPVQAQTVDSLTIARELEIEKVEVTGVKATPTRSTMSSTSVFDRKAGASAPVQTLESVLRLSPAIDLRERSGRGTQADIMIRGGSFDQTMVMLNGINFTDARTGHQSHSLPIDIDCIAGIDPIDGVSGVGAYAGALNIRTMPLKSRYLRIEAAGGDDGYAYGNLSGAVTKGRFSLFAAGSYRRSDGYIHNTDFENYNGYLRMNYDSEKAGFFDFQAGYQEPVVRFERFLCRVQSRSVRAYFDGALFAAMGEIRRAFHAQFVGQLPQEFRPLRLDARYADESSQYGQCGSRVLGRLYVEGRCDLPGRRLHLQPHLQHQSRRAASRLRTANIPMPRTVTWEISGCGMSNSGSVSTFPVRPG